MRMKEIVMDDGILQVKTDATEEKWKEVVAWVRKQPHQSKLVIFRELQTYKGVKIIVLR